MCIANIPIETWHYAHVCSMSRFNRNVCNETHTVRCEVQICPLQCLSNLVHCREDHIAVNRTLQTPLRFAQWSLRLCMHLSKDRRMQEQACFALWSYIVEGKRRMSLDLSFCEPESRNVLVHCSQNNCEVCSKVPARPPECVCLPSHGNTD